MRSFARWFLGSVLVLDAVFAIVFFAGSMPTLGAVAAPAAAAADAGTEHDAAAPWTREALDRLGKRLEARSAELDRRAAELEELARGAEVLRRAGVTDAGGEAAAEPTTARQQGSVSADAFERLQRAYANMEPESASVALARLAERDKEAVVRLILGWQPRTSGAVLDALTRTDPALAADLSYEIWKLGSAAEP